MQYFCRYVSLKLSMFSLYLSQKWIYWCMSYRIMQNYSCIYAFECTFYLKTHNIKEIISLLHFQTTIAFDHSWYYIWKVDYIRNSRYKTFLLQKPIVFHIIVFILHTTKNPICFIKFWLKSGLILFIITFSWWKLNINNNW